MAVLSLQTNKSSGFKTTDGRYSNDFIQERIREWIKFTLQTQHIPPLSKPLTTHLNQLFDTPADRESLVAVSFLTFRILIEQMEAMGLPDTYMPTLRIPLEDSETLIAGPVSAAALIVQLGYQPPSLYITPRSERMLANPIERYDFPLNIEDFTDSIEGIQIYYSTGRTQEDIRNGWEYGRNIMAQYYPKSYQILP